MIELLRLCGYEEQEIESDLPRVERAFNKLGITVTDIEHAKQRLVEYYDMELKGVRKAVGLCIKESVNWILAREEGKRKILYGIMSPGFETIGSALVSKSEELYVATLAHSLQFVIGCIFDKFVPILEAAEHKWLKSGKATHCANVKTMVGLIALDMIPCPDFLVTTGQFCDTAPKSLDLLHELYDIPTCCYDTCQDRDIREYPDAKRVIDLMAKSLRRLVLKIEDVVGFEITDDMLLEAINARRELSLAVMNLRYLMESSDPIPVGPAHEMIWHCLTSLPRSISELGELVAVLNTIYKELQSRINEGVGAVEKGSPRILALIPQHMTDPRLEHLLSELGIALVSSESGFFPTRGDRYPDPAEKRSEDPYELLAISLQSSLGQSLSARAAIIIEACKRLNVDGVLDRYHVGCRTGVGDALLIKDAITKELGIPVLLLEWEGFDPRIFNEEQYRRRLELFKDTLASNRQLR